MSSGDDLATPGPSDPGAPAGPSVPIPADKDELIRSMARAMRVAFKMASMYNADHPAFKSSVNDLMARLEALFVFINPLSIGFSPHALLIDGRFWEGERTYMDLAQLFHFRKIKRLEIRPGLPHAEFMRFASKIMLPVKLFIKEGGAQAIIKRETIIHISVDTLDYSILLQGEGEEIKDIWPYLLMEAVEEDDPEKLEELAGSFGKVVGKFNTEDLIQNEEMHKNFAKFFHYLKTTSEEKHRVASKQLLKSIVSARKTPTESKFENLKLLISDLSEEDLASTLWEEILGNDKFDSLSFSIFSRLIDKERHKKISTSLHALFHSDNPQNRRSETESKIRILLSGVSSQLHSEMYRQTLSNVLNEIAFDQKLTLDHTALQRNYRFLLLVLLSQGAQKEPALAELGRIAEEWPRIVDEGDFEFLLAYHEVLDAKSADLAAEPAFEEARRSIAEHVEGCLLRGETRPELDTFVEKLGRSLHDWEAYSATVFKDRIVSPSLLRACFRFFPDETEAFLRLDQEEVVRQRAPRPDRRRPAAHRYAALPRDAEEGLRRRRRGRQGQGPPGHAEPQGVRRGLPFPLAGEEERAHSGRGPGPAHAPRADEARRLHQALRTALTLRHPEQGAPAQPRHRRALRPARSRPVHRIAGRAEGFLEPQGPARGDPPPGDMA